MAHSGAAVFSDHLKDERITSKYNEGNNDIGNEAKVALGQPSDLPNLMGKLKSRHLQMIAIGECTILPLNIWLFLIR